MINAVSTVCIFVSDQDRAKAFYTEKLGFEVHMDAPMGPSRWIAVAPKGALTEIILYKMDENWEHYRAVMGHSQAVSLTGFRELPSRKSEASCGQVSKKGGRRLPAVARFWIEE